ncbi:MAG: anthranilate synthase component I family protein [Oscillospiraceae bacterium]|jgi:anthranilate synthase component 1|nr:anthranilate synthase component I family protein [Oscillospiraceae bacterium]
MTQTKPSLSEALCLAETYPMQPIWRSLPMGSRDPLDIFLACKRVSKQCFVLESAELGAHGRYTFLGYDPKLELACKDGVFTIKNGTCVRMQTNNPAAEIQRILSENRAPRNDQLPPFAGGLVGYFSYDFIKYSEPTLLLDAADEEGFKDLDLMLFDKVAAFDHQEQRIILIVNMRQDAPEENYHRAVTELDAMQRLIEKGEKTRLPALRITSPYRALFDQAQYCDMVEKAKKHIFEGDIFQVVLSNRLEADAEGSLFETYRMLRVSNPSPYQFYFSSDDVEIAGSAPETLVKLERGKVTTFPLAGTRPRGATPEADAQTERELLADEKERAEHNMLVDLGRNDLGRISQFGSVQVEDYMSVLRFSHVMHIGSTVSGRLPEDKTAVDAVAALLPAGTLSGAPKIRACEIINALENNKRGIYGGAIGYLSFQGDMDTCIAIRIAFKKNDKVFVRSGAGIVADSVPVNEYAECNHKMRAVLNALAKTDEGSDIQ